MHVYVGAEHCASIGHLFAAGALCTTFTTADHVGFSQYQRHVVDRCVLVDALTAADADAARARRAPTLLASQRCQFGFIELLFGDEKLTCAASLTDAVAELRKNPELRRKLDDWTMPQQQQFGKCLCVGLLI